MKSFVLSVFLSSCGLFAYNADAQKIEIKLHHATLPEVFRQIQNHSDYKVFYNDDLVAEEKSTFSFNFNGTVEEILNKIFSHSSLSYRLFENQIIIYKKSPATQPKTKSLFQQNANPDKEKLSQEQYYVEGTVTDENNNPLPGVSVALLREKRGDITRRKGEYRILVNADDTLVFSYLGYKTKHIPVNGRKTIDVKMEIAEKIIDSVNIIVQSNGYTRIPKERSTGSFSTISSSDLQEVPTININDRLEGKIPGLQVSTNSAGNESITIRGLNSYSDNTPLIVVDGFPMPEEDFTLTKDRNYSGQSTLSYLNPNDIESITVLKDAAAAAIWGSRAGNGVIVITTKQGNKTKPTVNFNTTITVGENIALNKLRNMNTAEYIEYEKELIERGFISRQTSSSAYGMSNLIAYNTQRTDDVIEIMSQADNGEITTEQRDELLNELGKIDNTKQIKKYLLRPSVSQQYNLSLSGGSKTATYFVSLGHNKDIPSMRGNSSDSYSVTINNGFNLAKWLTLSTGINYTKTKYISNSTVANALSESSDYGLRPYELLVDENGNSIDRYIRSEEAATYYEGLSGYKSWSYNYLDEVNYSSITTKGDNVRLNASLKAKITDWLSIEGSGMYSSIQDQVDYTNQQESYYARDLYNYFTYVSSTGTITHSFPDGEIKSITDSRTESQSLRGQFNVDKSFGTDHSIHVLGGAEIRDVKGSSSNNYMYGYNPDTNSYNTSFNPSSSGMTVSGWSSQYNYYVRSESGTVTRKHQRYLSYFGLGSYDFKNKYHLSASIRFDDYNLLGASRRDRAIPLWSIGGKWDISKENFLEPYSWISNLAIRMTYGKSGVVPPNIGNTYALITTGTDTNTGLSTATITSPSDSHLKWETTATYNLGLDFGFFHNRLSGSLEYYYKKSDDLLDSAPINPTYGFTTLTRNVGNMKGHGIDLGITGRILDKEIKWESSLNFSYTTNTLTDSNYDTTDNANSYVGSGNKVKGKPLAAVYAYRWAGLDNTGQSTVYTKDGTVLSASELSSATFDDLKYMGTTNAPYYGGFLNTFSYKNFTFGFRMSYFFGYVFVKDDLNNYPTYASGYSTVSKSSAIVNRWQNAGDETKTNVPGLENISYNSLNAYNGSDINVLPADHIRLQQVSFGYRLPQNFLTKYFIRNAEINFVVRNLGLLWTKNKENIDPVYHANNGYSSLSPSRNYSLQLNLTF